MLCLNHIIPEPFVLIISSWNTLPYSYNSGSLCVNHIILESLSYISNVHTSILYCGKQKSLQQTIPLNKTLALSHSCPAFCDVFTTLTLLNSNYFMRVQWCLSSILWYFHNMWKHHNVWLVCASAYPKAMCSYSHTAVIFSVDTD